MTEESRDELARQADEVRSKLFRTIEQIDGRRHDALDLPARVERRLRQAAWIGGLLLLATVGAAALVMHGVTTGRARKRHARWRLASQAWQHPDRALRSQRLSFFGELARSVALGVAHYLILIPARRSVARLLTARLGAASPHDIGRESSNAG